MQSCNRVYLVGTLGSDPKALRTRNDKPYCRISIGTDGRPDDKGEVRPTWHLVQVFGKQAETVLEYMKKGRKVCVEGHLENTTKDRDGKVNYRTWVTADRVTFLSGEAESNLNPLSLTADGGIADIGAIADMGGANEPGPVPMQ
jgi:single-strand DNA-binding protein